MRGRLFAHIFVLLAATWLATAAPPAHSLVAVGNMSRARWDHTATLLPDGRVLIAGGDDASAELYDPRTRAFVPTGSMTESRRMHSATALPDGRVLVAGGWGSSTAELYDPATGTFTSTGSLLEDQGGHSATLLSNGTVLIAGGQRSAPPWPTAARAEIYDIATGTFSFAGDYASSGTLYPSGGPVWPTANVLPDGRVLIVGDNPSEVYDPASNSFSLTDGLASPGYRYGMYWHTATTLKSGAVLITGGSDDLSCGGLSDAQLYDPSSGGYRIVGPLRAPRDGHTSTLLPSGEVLIAGGGSGGCWSPTLKSTELFDESSQRFVQGPDMIVSRAFHTATLLTDGSVLLVGGISYWPYAQLRSAVLFRPSMSWKRRAVIGR